MCFFSKTVILEYRYHLFVKNGTVLGKLLYSEVRVPIFLMEFFNDIELSEGNLLLDRHKKVQIDLLIFNNFFSKILIYAIKKHGFCLFVNM